MPTINDIIRLNQYQKEQMAMVLDINDTSRSLEFQFNPITIKETYNPKYVDHDIPGLEYQRPQWSNGTLDKLNFTVEFFYSEPEREDVKRKCLFLKSFQYPDFITNSKLVKAPKLLMFKFGSLYNDIYQMRKCEIKYYDLFDTKTLLPMKAIVDIELVKEPPDGDSDYGFMLVNKPLNPTFDVDTSANGARFERGKSTESRTLEAKTSPFDVKTISETILKLNKASLEGGKAGLNYGLPFGVGSVLFR